MQFNMLFIYSLVLKCVFTQTLLLPRLCSQTLLQKYLHSMLIRMWRGLAKYISSICFSMLLSLDL